MNPLVSLVRPHNVSGLQSFLRRVSIRQFTWQVVFRVVSRVRFVKAEVEDLSEASGSFFMIAERSYGSISASLHASVMFNEVNALEHTSAKRSMKSSFVSGTRLGELYEYITQYILR